MISSFWLFDVDEVEMAYAQAACGRSPVAAEMFLPNIYIDDPIQLSLFASAETVTVTVVPAGAAVSLIEAFKKAVGLPIRFINRKSIR